MVNRGMQEGFSNSQRLSHKRRRDSGLKGGFSGNFRWISGGEDPSETSGFMLFVPGCIGVADESIVDGAGGKWGVAIVRSGLGTIDWALSHSLQDTIALLTNCCCVIDLDSKISWLRLSQSPQQIQGKMLEMIPTGGRLTRREEISSSSWKEIQCVESKLTVHGESFQTGVAKGQRNKTWRRVSGTPHREQLGSLCMFLRRRLSHVGKQSLAHFHKKCFNFGSKGGVQMFFCQFQDSLSKSVVVDWILETGWNGILILLGRFHLLFLSRL